jgi:hypothetical protein
MEGGMEGKEGGRKKERIIDGWMMDGYEQGKNET